MRKQQFDDRFSKARAAVLTNAEHLSCGMEYDPAKFSALVDELCAASVAWFIAGERRAVAVQRDQKRPRRRG
jgi:hypothetical protein